MYQISYIQGVESPLSERGELGTAIHTAIQEIYVAEKFERKFLLDAFHKMRNKFPIISDEVWKEGFPLLQRWFTGASKRGWLKKPLMCEGRFEIALSSQVTMTGKIDLVIPSKDDLLVIDWKTARGVPKESRLMKEPQMVFYSLACRYLFGRDVRNLKSILYFIRSDSAFGFRFNLPDFRFLAERIFKMKEDIDDGNFPTTKNDSCQYCPSASTCELIK